MKKLQYSLSICLELISPEDGETIDCNTETEYFDTLEEATTAAAKYKIGDIVSRYGDGVESRFVMIEVSEDPEEVEYFD